MNIISDIAAAQDEIRSIRRWLHAHPELGFEETQTGDVVAKKLSEYGIEVHRGLGRTGVVGVLQAGTSKRSIGLRADMDALPIHELNEFSHKSEYVGKMHACGHDGHMAMLLGAAQFLAKTRNFDGTIVFIFSPAEEAGNGAQVMVEEGIFSMFPVDAVFGLHNHPGMEVGKFGVRTGAFLGGCGEFRITVGGVDGHAAHPEEANDPIFTAVQLYNSFQGIITRNKPALAPAVISVTQFNGWGHARNVIPHEAILGGTVRVLDIATLDLIEARMRAIVDGIARANGCEINIEFNRTVPPTVNTARETEFAVEVMRSIVGPENVDSEMDPGLGVEDFAFMLQARPGTYACIGAGFGEHRDAGHGPGPCICHNASYDFNDSILGLGSTYWVELAQRWLKPVA